jgi:hypothetical protein
MNDEEGITFKSEKRDNVLSDEELEIEFTYMLTFMKHYFNFTPYTYQKRFLKECLRSNRISGIWCRQSGKSTSVAAFTLYTCLNTTSSIVIVAPTQSQSGELYEKIRAFMGDNQNVKKYLVKETETEMKFMNGSRIVSLPCGPNGASIRGYTADIEIIEEAGIMKDSIVNNVIVPMIASKKDKGKIIKIGTPLTKNHFYNSCYKDEKYKVFKVDYKECLDAGVYSQDFIDEQKENLLEIEFESEYNANFITDVNAFFPDELIDKSREDYPLCTNF